MLSQRIKVPRLISTLSSLILLISAKAEEYPFILRSLQSICFSIRVIRSMVARDSSDNYTTRVIHTAPLVLSTYLDNHMKQTPQYRFLHFPRHHIKEGLCELLEKVKR